MAFVTTVPVGEAVGAVRAMYAREQAACGYVPNYAKVFSLRPEILALWERLLSGVKRHAEPRRYEMATVAAAQALRSSYCGLGHVRALARHLPPEQVRAVVAASEQPELSAADAAVVRFARKVARQAHAVTAEDVEALRRVGLGDEEIFDLAAIVAVRAFFTTVLDALGAAPDSALGDLDVGLRDQLTIGRAIESSAPERL